jgi:hypothetical protein
MQQILIAVGDELSVAGRSLSIAVRRGIFGRGEKIFGELLKRRRRIGLEIILIEGQTAEIGLARQDGRIELGDIAGGDGVSS